MVDAQEREPLLDLDTVTAERRGAAGIVRLNRPDRLNAISRLMAADLRRSLDLLAGLDSVAAIVLTGEGRTFSAGADLSELSSLDDIREFERFLADLHGLLDAIGELDKPTIAAVHGAALGGGCELALACDLRITAAGTRIGLPEVKVGVMPGAGGTQRLPRLLAPALAARMLLLGDPISAEQALDQGLVNEVVADAAGAVGLAEEWAARFAALPPLAVRTGKHLLRIAADSDLHTGLWAERQSVALLFASADRSEGMRAFLENRPPRFIGR